MDDEQDYRDGDAEEAARTAAPAGKSEGRGGISRTAWFLLMFLFLAAILLDAFFSESGILKIWEMERDYVKLSQEIADLERENAKMEAEIKALRDSPEAIERIAREQLDFIRPGEEVFLFPEKDKDR